MILYLSGGKLIALLDPEKSDYAVNILCNWDSSYSGIELKVSAVVLKVITRSWRGVYGCSKYSGSSLGGGIWENPVHLFIVICISDMFGRLRWSP